jgi:hypothetical protein
MTAFRAICALSAFVCVSAQAQECSGGPGGGVDATGNQCSIPGAAVDTSSPATELARPAAAISAPMPVHALATGSRMTGASAPATRTASVRQPADRFPAAAKASTEPIHTAKISESHEPSCSGGVDGGIDATGNQCNSVDGATSVALVRPQAR